MKMIIAALVRVSNDRRIFPPIQWKAMYFSDFVENFQLRVRYPIFPFTKKMLGNLEFFSNRFLGFPRKCKNNSIKQDLCWNRLTHFYASYKNISIDIPPPSDTMLATASGAVNPTKREWVSSVVYTFRHYARKPVYSYPAVRLLVWYSSIPGIVRFPYRRIRDRQTSTLPAATPGKDIAPYVLAARRHGLEGR